MNTQFIVVLATDSEGFGVDIIETYGNMRTLLPFRFLSRMMAEAAFVKVCKSIDLTYFEISQQSVGQTTFKPKDLVFNEYIYKLGRAQI